MSKVKLDRSNWSKIQFGSGAPVSGTPGNIYFDASTGDLYLRRTTAHPWVKNEASAGVQYWTRSGTELSPTTSGDTAQEIGRAHV